MLFSVICEVVKGLLFLSLHVGSNGTFPPALSAKKEAELLQKMKDGDNDARNKLIEHNLRLVAHIVKKYYSGNVEQDDLISIGTIGLIKAVTTFDDSKGIRLATYAARCIENEILMCFRAQKKSANDVYISDPIETDKEGNTLTLIDVIADTNDIAENIELKLKSDRLRKYVATRLNPRERQIIVMRYGLFGERPLTQREVAEQLKISRSYVSRLEKKALTELYDIFKKEKGM